MYHKSTQFASKLLEILLKRQEESGPLSFDEFMDISLYHPGLGYYARRDLPIGKKGDFVTSPHASPLFGAIMCEQFMQMADILGSSEFFIVEMGSGSGILMKDILSYWKRVRPQQFDTVFAVIVEPLENLREIQQETLKGLGVEHVSSLNELGPVNGCVFSNELIDAFPVHVVEKKDDTIKEVFLTIDDGGGVHEVLREIEWDDLRIYCQRYLCTLPNDYRTEVNLRARDWVIDVSRVLKRGFVLTIDYGYSRDEYLHPGRNRGTLLGYLRHQIVEDIYSAIGEMDLTHHVNFSDIVQWGREYGLRPIGYCNQLSFIAAFDVDRIIKVIMPGGVSPFSPALAGIKMLLFPQGMGETHKFLIQAKGIDEDISLTGFRLQNKIERLIN